MARRIQRVMPLLLKEEKNINGYVPKVVSIGPYHHGKRELAPVEAFKPLAVHLFVSGGAQNMDFYNRELLGIIGEIRECYEENPTADYSNDQLAQLMLHDACFIINQMEICTTDTAQPAKPLTYIKMVNMVNSLGMLTVTIAFRDMFLLENQIPLDVIKLLINLRYGAGEYENLLNRYLNFCVFVEYGYRQEKVLKMEMGKQPLHLLEAFHRLLISDFAELNKNGDETHTIRDSEMAAAAQEISGRMIMAAAAPAITNPYHLSTRGISRWLICCPRSRCFDIECGVGPKMISGKQGMILGLLRTLACKKAAKNPKKEKVIHSFRSVTELKAKGIYSKPGPTNSLKDVAFKSHFFYATLQLPYLKVTIFTKAFFLNMVAYELSPSSSASCEVTSYINFMKSLLERPEDVKELREKKILCNYLGSDQEVLSVYKDINTYCADNSQIFKHVKDKIEAHYQSRTKIWMAELIHTYFRTPWTIIAFLGAISLLALTAVQVQYAIHPN